MSARPFVDLAVPPYVGELDCWGQDARGWWGLVTWCEYVIQDRRMMRRSAIMCSGWVAVRQLREKPEEDYSEVPRIELSDDEALWPPPADRGAGFWWPVDSHHVGVLTAQPYALPEGYRSLKRTPS